MGPSNGTAILSCNSTSVRKLLFNIVGNKNISTSLVVASAECEVLDSISVCSAVPEAKNYAQ